MSIVTKTEPGDLPFVSVVMPVLNEAEFIKRSLGAIAQQTYPKGKMEVIVADGMSTDETRSLITEIAANTTLEISIVDNPNKIAPTGLNCAFARAKGEIIVRVDGHCEIEPQYVANCVSHLTAGKAEGVGGPIETIGEGIQAKAIALAMSSGFGVGGSAFRTVSDREMYTDTVAFPGYTREIIEKAGPFNEELVRNQDDEYNYRIRKLGGRILLSPDIRSRYYSRSTFRSLWRQYFQYGYWKVRVFQIHPAQMSIRQFVPLAFVLSLILGTILIFVPAIGIWPLAALSALYLIANVSAALSIGRQHLTLIPPLMLSFAILHLSYGSGFLYGLFAFAGTWLRPKTVNAIQADGKTRFNP